MRRSVHIRERKEKHFTEETPVKRNLRATDNTTPPKVSIISQFGELEAKVSESKGSESEEFYNAP